MFRLRKRMDPTGLQTCTVYFILLMLVLILLPYKTEIFFRHNFGSTSLLDIIGSVSNRWCLL